MIINELKGNEVDIILSDMAPNTTGIKDLDHGKVMVRKNQVNFLDFSRFRFEFCKIIFKKRRKFCCKDIFRKRRDKI